MNNNHIHEVKRIPMPHYPLSDSGVQVMPSSKYQQAPTGMFNSTSFMSMNTPSFNNDQSFEMMQAEANQHDSQNAGAEPGPFESTPMVQNHFQTVLSELLNFIDGDILDASASCMNIDLCPLQTPCTSIPHHVESKEYLREKLHDSLVRLRGQVQASQLQLGDVPAKYHIQLPDLKNLHAYYNHYSQPEYKARFAPIITCLNDIRDKSERLWDERAQMRTKLNELFEGTICNVCTQVIKAEQRLCPYLHELVIKRKAQEQLVHDQYRIHSTRLSDDRKIFYKQVTDWIHQPQQDSSGNSNTSLLQVLKKMLAVLENEIVEIPDTPEPILPHLMSSSDIRNSSRATSKDQLKEKWKRSVSYKEAQEVIKNLKTSLNTWQDVLLAHRHTNSKFPILPELLLALEQWLLTFQTEFLRMIGEKVPKGMAEDMFDLNAMDVLQGISKRGDNPALQLFKRMERQQSENEDEDEDEDECDESGNEDIEEQKQKARKRYKTPQRQQQQSKQQQQKPMRNTGFMGLRDLTPTCKEFFQYTHAKVQEEFMNSQYRQAQMAQHQRATLDEIDAILNLRAQKSIDIIQQTPFLPQSNSSEPTQAGPTVSGGSGAASIASRLFLTKNNTTPVQGNKHLQMVATAMGTESTYTPSKMFELERRLQLLQQRALVLQQQYFKLKPRLERQHEMMRSLNSILEVMNSFTLNHAQKWMMFIQKESEISNTMLRMEEAYVTSYLTHRNDTRVMIRRFVNNSRAQLSEYLNQAFRDLGLKHDELVQNFTQMQDQCTEEVAQARAVIDVHHTAIGDKLLEASSAIAQIVKHTDDTLESKRQIHYFHYITDMQALSIAFIDSVGKMLDAYFTDTSLEQYLTTLDKVCIEQNAEGCAPRSRLSMSANGVPNFDHLSNGCLAPYTWTTLKEYPRTINPLNLMSDAPSLLKTTEKAVRDNVYHNEPDQIQKDAVRVVDSMHQHNVAKSQT